jgi:hypothetical protein
VADDFENAFTEFVKLEDVPSDTPPTPPTSGGPAGSPAPPVAPPAGSPGSVQRPSESVESEIEPPDEPPIPGAKAPVLDNDALERIIAGLAAKVPPQPAPRAPGPMPPAPLVNEAEKVILQSFYKDWGDVAQANEIMLRVTSATIERRMAGQIAALRDAMYSEMADILRPKFEILDALATRAQLAFFEEKVPDYDAVAEKIVPWVEKQPAYLRAAYTNVMQTGTEDEVLDLIQRYQQSTGVVAGGTQAPPVPSTQPPAARRAAELSNAAKQAAAQLAPVRSARTGASAVTAPTDFDGAFEEALRVMANAKT